ncbi:LEC-6 protein [Aphelenchoides avenae]|nr:LEC-6 protein [Aphelenchus avenae]
MNYGFSFSCASPPYKSASTPAPNAPGSKDHFNVPTPFSVRHRGFKCGDRIRVTLVPVHGCQRRFNVDLRQSVTDTVIFHFNPRFDQKQVVMNSTRNGCWLDEIRPHVFPFERGTVTTIDFIAESATIRVNLDGKYFASFPARDDLRYVDTLVVDGDVEVHCVTTANP